MEGILMVIKTLFPDLTKPLSAYEDYLELVSDERREKIFRFHSDQSKIISLMSAVFARECISKVIGIPPAAVNFNRNEFGKPEVAGSETFHFNISHSENCIAFVHGTKPVGIDVERITGFDARLPKRYFTEHERSMLEMSHDKDLEFYKIWTTKEAYIKMKGSTLAQMIRHVDIYNIRDAEINTINERGFLITACEQQYN
jgi:4'-phosphopantetheinyl transferase